MSNGLLSEAVSSSSDWSTLSTSQRRIAQSNDLEPLKLSLISQWSKRLLAHYLVKAMGVRPRMSCRPLRPACTLKIDISSADEGIYYRSCQLSR
jgi:hypothetical protein